MEFGRVGEKFLEIVAEWVDVLCVRKKYDYIFIFLRQNPYGAVTFCTFFRTTNFPSYLLKEKQNTAASDWQLQWPTDNWNKCHILRFSFLF